MENTSNLPAVATVAGLANRSGQPLANEYAHELNHAIDQTAAKSTAVIEVTVVPARHSATSARKFRSLAERRAEERTRKARFRERLRQSATAIADKRVDGSQTEDEIDLLPGRVMWDLRAQLPATLGVSERTANSLARGAVEQFSARATGKGRTGVVRTERIAGLSVKNLPIASEPVNGLTPIEQAIRSIRRWEPKPEIRFSVSRLERAVVLEAWSSLPSSRPKGWKLYRELSPSEWPMRHKSGRPFLAPLGDLKPLTREESWTPKLDLAAKERYATEDGRMAYGRLPLRVSMIRPYSPRRTERVKVTPVTVIRGLLFPSSLNPMMD